MKAIENRWVTVAVASRWRRIGSVRRDSDGRLVFPRTDQVQGVYRLRLRGTPTEWHYVGETDELRRRFQHFRAPGFGQPTKRRIKGLLVEHLEVECEAEVDVAAGHEMLSR